MPSAIFEGDAEVLFCLLNLLRNSPIRVTLVTRPFMKNDQSFATGCMAVIGLIVSVLYLANLTFGILEIPDNLPIIGNLDEVFFSGVMFASLARFGIYLPFGNRPSQNDNTVAQRPKE